MTKIIVDRFKVIDIDHDAGKRFPVPLGFSYQFFESAQAAAPVRQTGQRVGHCHCLELTICSSKPGGVFLDDFPVPLNGLLSNTLVQFPAYLLAGFILPLVYGAWRLVLFHAITGPVLAAMLTSDPNEMPAIWCLFSIGIILISLSPTIRHRVMGAPVEQPT